MAACDAVMRVLHVMRVMRATGLSYRRVAGDALKHPHRLALRRASLAVAFHCRRSPSFPRSCVEQVFTGSVPACRQPVGGHPSSRPSVGPSFNEPRPIRY